MEDLLTSSYNDGTRVDGVLSPYDGISRGVITALQNAGYGPALDAQPQPMAVVTGQDAEIASVKLINDGVQSSTIFKDTRLLAEQAVAAAQAFLEGNEPEANDTETYDNGVKVVPSYLLPIETVYKDDIQTKLVDSGYGPAAAVAPGPPHCPRHPHGPGRGVTPPEILPARAGGRPPPRPPAAPPASGRHGFPRRPAAPTLHEGSAHPGTTHEDDGVHGRHHPGDAFDHEDLPRRQGAGERQPGRSPR